MEGAAFVAQAALVVPMNADEKAKAAERSEHVFRAHRIAGLRGADFRLRRPCPRLATGRRLAQFHSVTRHQQIRTTVEIEQLFLLPTVE